MFTLRVGTDRHTLALMRYTFLALALLAGCLGGPRRGDDGLDSSDGVSCDSVDDVIAACDLVEGAGVSVCCLGRASINGCPETGVPVPSCG